MEEIRITYSDLKQRLDREMTTAAQSFIRIGYYLRVARDTDALAGSGYDNVNDFAKAEYGLDRSQVSRFIRINERFGSGNALQDNYEGFGSSKLAEMLLLPDMVAGELPQEISKSEIRELAADLAEDRKTTDLELAMEDHSDEPLVLQAFREYFHLRPDEYVETANLWHRGYPTMAIMDVLAPTGQAMKTIRLQGIGKVCVSFRGSRPVSIMAPRTGQKEEMPVGELAEQIGVLFAETSLPPRAAWEYLYGQPWEGEAGDPEEEPETKAGEPETKAEEPEAEESRERTEEGSGTEEAGAGETGGEEEKPPVVPAQQPKPLQKSSATGKTAAKTQRKVVDIVKLKEPEPRAEESEVVQEPEPPAEEPEVIQVAESPAEEPEITREAGQAEEPEVTKETDPEAVEPMEAIPEPGTAFTGMNPPETEEGQDADPQAEGRSRLEPTVKWDWQTAMVNEVTRRCSSLVNAAKKRNWDLCRSLLANLKEYVDRMQRFQEEKEGTDGEQMGFEDFPELMPEEGE